MLRTEVKSARYYFTYATFYYYVRPQTTTTGIPPKPTWQEGGDGERASSTERRKGYMDSFGNEDRLLTQLEREASLCPVTQTDRLSERLPRGSGV